MPASARDESPLLIPIFVDALVVNDWVQSHVVFSRDTPDYRLLAEFQPPLAEPAPGVNSQPPARGVHLHWALPDALTRAKHDESTDSLEFPAVPTRWLVVRWSPAAPLGIGSAAWIVESDRSDASSRSWFVAADGTAQRIGRSVASAAWAESDQSPTFLRAVGPGDPSFAAMATTAENVFSIHDPLLAAVPAGAPLTYVVVGWHAAAADEPQLSPALGWSLDGATTSRSLYHGFVRGVGWSESDPIARASSDPAKLRVALGNSSDEALVALLANELGPGIDPGLLAALVGDSLAAFRAPGGDAVVTEQLHANGFSGAAGGLRWRIAAGRDPENQPSADALATGSRVAAELTAQQSELDATLRNVFIEQERLHELWWKQGRAARLLRRPPGWPEGLEIAAFRDAVATSLATQTATVTAALSDLTARRARIPNPEAADDAAESAATFARSRLPDSLELQHVPLPPLVHPTDPVIAIAGVEVPPKHGQDNRLASNGLLPCRRLAAVVRGVVVDAERVVTIDSAAPPAWLPLPALGAVPGAAAALVIEAWLLDPANVAAMLQAALETNEPALIGSVRAKLAAGTGLLGTPPAANAARDWQQAWTPIHFEWCADYHPTGGPTADGALDWSFDGTSFQGPSTVPDRFASYAGRALLSLHLGHRMRDKLGAELGTSLGSDCLSKLRADLTVGDEWCILSQSISGLHDQLLTRQPAAIKRAAPPLDALVGAAARWALAVRLGESDAGEPAFFPVRAGYLRLRHLRIVDAFGQVLDLLAANGNAGNNLADTFRPIRASSLMPPAALEGAAGAIALPPRLVPPSRLSLTANASSPLVGFLIASASDQTLTLFNSDGSCLGLAAVTALADGTLETTDLSPPGIGARSSQSQLASLWQTLLARGTGGTALAALIDTIDAASWAHPTRGVDDNLLQAYLWGQPLALVAASLELLCTPVRNLFWQNTFDVGSAPRVALPFRIGAPRLPDDGVVGYFIDPQLSTLYTAHDVAPSGFVCPLGKARAWPTITPGQSLDVTLLMDPRAVAHVATDALPVSKMQLDARLWSDAARSLEHIRPAGPVLGRGGAVPIPQGKTTPAWSWRQADRNSPDGWRRLDTAAPSAAAQFSGSALLCRDGWLSAQVAAPSGTRPTKP